MLNNYIEGLGTAKSSKPSSILTKVTNTIKVFSSIALAKVRGMMRYEDLKEYNSQDILNVDKTHYTHQELRDLEEVAGLLSDLEEAKKGGGIDITNMPKEERRKILFGE